MSSFNELVLELIENGRVGLGARCRWRLDRCLGHLGRLGDLVSIVESLKTCRKKIYKFQSTFFLPTIRSIDI